MTSRQLEVLRLRSRGITQEKVASILKTSRENITLIESRAHRNVRRAQETVSALEQVRKPWEIRIKPGTAVLDIPKIVLRKADEADIRTTLNVVEILEKVRSEARPKVKGKTVVKMINLKLDVEGTLTVQ